MCLAVARHALSSIVCRPGICLRYKISIDNIIQARNARISDSELRNYVTLKSLRCSALARVSRITPGAGGRG
jgi:hypothetical protein